MDTTNFFSYYFCGDANFNLSPAIPNALAHSPALIASSSLRFLLPWSIFLYGDRNSSLLLLLLLLADLLILDAFDDDI